jgi:hypothetical protein
VRRCKVCGHPNRVAIEAAVSQGLSLRDAATEWGVDYQAIRRHKMNHLIAAESVPVALPMAVGSDIGLSPSSRPGSVAAPGNVVSFPRTTSPALPVLPGRNVELVQNDRRKRQATIRTFLNLKGKGLSTADIAEELAISEEEANSLEVKADDALAFLPSSRSAEWIAGHSLQSYVEEIAEREDMYEEARHRGTLKQALDIRESIVRVKRELLDRMKEFGMLDGLRDRPDKDTTDILQSIKNSIGGVFVEPNETEQIERLF